MFAPSPNSNDMAVTRVTRLVSPDAGPLTDAHKKWEAGLPKWQPGR